jgi:hypothetical protein
VPARIALLTALLALSSSCVVEHMPDDESALLSRFPIADGHTSRADVLLHYGPPSSEYEADRILVYRFGRGDDGPVLLSHSAHWSKAEFNLVLVFDERQVLTRHSLLRLRP